MIKKRIVSLLFILTLMVSSNYSMQPEHTKHCDKMTIETLCDAALADCATCFEKLLNEGCNLDHVDRELQRTCSEIAETNENQTIIELIKNKRYSKPN